MTSTVAIGLALIAVALLHGATAGVRASAGRDGRIRHRAAEGVGALRGMAVVATLLTPFAVAALWDASSSPERWNTYVDAAGALLLVYGPVAAIMAGAFVAARTTPWAVRAFISTVVIGGMEFVRPVVALGGVALAWWHSGDLLVGLLATGAITAALQASRITAAAWYSGPVTIPEPAPALVN